MKGLLEFCGIFISFTIKIIDDNIREWGKYPVLKF